MHSRRAFDLALRWVGLAAVLVSLGIVAFLVGGLLTRGLGALDWQLLVRADSVEAARAGTRTAWLGSALTLAIALAVAIPLGVATALWLEELAPPRRSVRLIALLIANLAAVPPIIFGLLGLALFIGAWGLPRSTPLVAGLTLALMTMPVIVIAGRAALAAVPEAIRDAARGLGASPAQVAIHHVLPLAAPGIVTGMLFAAARALGEMAPLLLIGMNAFIAAPDASATAPATVLPMQVFLWSDRLDHGFVERTAAACLVLLAVLLALTGTAAWLRQRWERGR